MIQPAGDDGLQETIEPLGDCALLVRLGDRIDDGLNRRAHALAALLSKSHLPGVGDVSAAFASVCIRYDPGAWADPVTAQSPYQRLSAAIVELIRSTRTSASLPRQSTERPFEIPVCYGGHYGADIEVVAAQAGIDNNEVIARHSAGAYRVAMLGFMPGFAYLTGLDPALHTPRRATPRTRVPAGSVAIGAAQTGIYPRELPGGWQLIGRTPLILFDPGRAQPALLSPGQSVRFCAIDPGEFARLSS